MAQSSGWSKPVWDLFATSSRLNSGVAKASRMSRPRKPGFMFASVKGWGPVSGSPTSPENATSTPIR